MARVSWRGGDVKKIALRIENIPEELMEMANDVIDEVTDDGAELMREYIMTRATDKVRERYGREGRYRPGKAMYKAVKSGTKQNRRSVVGTFGWGVDGSANEDYFRFQEEGFRHWISGEDIVPMHALLDAYMETRERFFARMREEMRIRRNGS